MRTLTDIALEQERLEKSFKYIRRFWKNGRWNYVYEEPQREFTPKQWGEVYKGFEGKPKEALNHLLKKQQGQCMDVATVMLPVIYRGKDGKLKKRVGKNGKPILIPTSVDVVWGTETKGFAHILDKHYVKHDDYKSVEDCVDAVAYTLQNFDDEPYVQGKDGRFKIKGVDAHGNEVSIGVEVVRAGKSRDLIRHFVLTSYDGTRQETDKELPDEEINRRRKIVDGYKERSDR